MEPLDGLGISLDGVYRTPNGNLENSGSGFDNVYYRVKQELWTDVRHEFQFSAGMSGQIANPGVVWVGNHFNIATELVVPGNSASGKGTGFLVQYQQFFGK